MSDESATSPVQDARVEQGAASDGPDEGGRADTRWPSSLLLLLSAFGLCTLAFTVAARAAFPWPLEWMEGASLQHALRLLRGQPLYAAPAAEFIPYLYPPLAYLPMALSAALFGPSLPAARLASIACAALAIALIGRAAARAAGASSAGWAAAGLFALGYGFTGAFLDLARVDACFVLLIAAAAERLLAQRPRAALLWLVLSAFAKQHGVVLLAAVSGALLVREPRRAGPAVAVSWVVLLAGCAVLELASSGWFGRYVLELPRDHGVDPALFLSFFAVDLLVYLPVLVVASVLTLARHPRASGAFEALLVAALVAGALGRAHAGGHDNVRLPAFALLCIAGVAPLCRTLLAPASTRRVRIALCAALIAQFALLWQAPSYHAPPQHSAARFAELQGALQRCARGGRPVALDHALLTGVPFVHTMALSDLRMGESRALAGAASKRLLDALCSQDAPAAIAVGESFPALDRVIAECYQPCAEVASPALATGYLPGAPGPTGKLQRIYTLRRGPGLR
jgi:hypothetical protein